MEESSLIVLIDCWTSFEGVFVNKWSYCWSPRDVMAATLDDMNKSISLHWELNPIHLNFSKKFYCITIQHGRLVMWLQTKNSIKDTKCPHCNNCLYSNKCPCSVILL